MKFRDFTPDEKKALKKALVRMHNDIGKMYMNFKKDTKDIKHREFPEMRKGLAEECKGQRDNLKALIQMISQNLLK